MKPIVLGLLPVAAAGIAMFAAPPAPQTVQGVPYTPREAGDAHSGNVMPLDYEWYIPEDMPAPDGQFTFDMIKFWAGEGENSAALVIQWNQHEEQNALVFGYHWDGIATGADMIRAVVAAYPRLYGLIQYTNVSSPTDPLGGYTINGFGWDSDNDGDIALIDTKDGQIYETPDGLFIHPRGYNPELGGSSDYDYDDWKARDADDLWGAGWYLSYWSYWVKDSYDQSFSYSGWGASGRVLTDGSWDGWNFSLDMIPRDWKEFVAAPALVPPGAHTEFTADGLCYSLADYAKRTVRLTAPRNGTEAYRGDINVPETFVANDTAYTVVEIDEKAFELAEIDNVTIPATVKKIGKEAFRQSSIKSLAVAGRSDYETVTSLGDFAFFGCGRLTTLVLPTTFTAIPAGAFAGTAISKLSIPEGVESIGEQAFMMSPKLSEITLASTLKTIGEEAFANCPELKKVVNLSTSPLAMSETVFGNVSTATLTVPYGYADLYRQSSGWNKFGAYEEQTIAVNVGDIFMAGGMTYRVTKAGKEGNTVTATYCRVDGKPTGKLIGAANSTAYTGALVLPATVSYQKQQFAVTELNDSAFYGADKLTSVVIEFQAPKIGRHTFYDCSSLESVVLPPSVKSIDNYAFSYTGIKSLKLPEGVETLGERAFFQTPSLAEINVPSTVTAIGNNCFAYATALESIVIPDGVTSLGSTLFQNCKSLKSAKLPAGLTAIPASTFSSCAALTDFTFPEACVEIKSSAFSGCSQLPLSLPATVKTLGTEAFKGCKMIREFRFPEGVTSIPNSILYDCTNLERVVMSDDVTAIGSNSFRNCTSLKIDSLPARLTSIGSYGFAGCSSLDSIVLPEGFKTLNTYAFADCRSLRHVSLPSTLTTIAGYTFRNTALSQLIVPGKCTSLSGADIVNGCNDITIYTLNTSPGTCGSYSWRIKTSPATFAPIVVPSGTSALYTAKNYWKKSSVSEPVATGITLTDLQIADTLDEAGCVNIKGKIALKFDIGSLPAEVAALDSRILLSSASLTLENSMSANGLTFNAETGEFTADIASETENAALKVVIGDSTFTSQPFAVYFPAPGSNLNTMVDFSKIEYTIGDGPMQAALIMSWNDTNRGADHLVWGVNFEPGATPGQIAATVIDSDSRLYRLENGYGYDVLDKGNLSQVHDHWSTDGDDCRWQLFGDSLPRNGSVIYLSYCPETAADEIPAAPAYTFPIPAADKLGARVPDGYKCQLADTTLIPVWARVGAYGLNGFTVTFDPSRPMTPVTDGVAEGCAMIAAKVYSSPDEQFDPSFYSLKVNVEVSPEFNHPEGLEEMNTLGDGSWSEMQFVEPERPITSLFDTEVPVTRSMPPTRLCDVMKFEPADATYTDLDLYTMEGEKINLDYGGYFLGEESKYYASDRQIEIEAGGESRMFEVRSRINPDVKAMIYFNVNRYPVTEVYLEGVGDDDNIRMTAHDILALMPAVKPAEARNTVVTVSVDNMSAENIVTTYPVGGSCKFTELVTYAPGSFDLTLTSAENSSVTRTYHVTVLPQEAPDADIEFADGTFWLNEEWFTHKNGSINYLTSPLPDDEESVIYRAYASANDDRSFGATSQFGMIHGNKLFVMSKQAADAGDLRGASGGRLVVADAATLRTIATFDEIGGDGRACVGVSASKAYIGTNAGIRVLKIGSGDELTLAGNIGKINNGADAGLYNRQIGDMVLAGRYVFAIQQGVGTHIIDTDDDTLVATIADEKVQGVTQAADGNVWIASSSDAPAGMSTLTEIDFETLEQVRSVNVPGTIVCSWGSWRSTNFFASAKQNVLFWNGGASSIEGSGSTFYRWDLDSDTDPASLQPLMTMPREEGVTSDVTRQTYASMRYDDRCNMILAATTTAPSGNYRYNWYNFINASTGAIERQIRLKDYYWFPALPIFPDKYTPEFTGLDAAVILTDYNPDADPDLMVTDFSIDLKTIATDRDNNDNNIAVTCEWPADADNLAEIAVTDGVLTIHALRPGESSLNFTAESNGRSTTVNIPLKITHAISGISTVRPTDGVITVVGNRVNVRGMAGETFIVFDVNGRAVSGFRAETGDCNIQLTLPAGVYVISSETTNRNLKFILK